MRKAFVFRESAGNLRDSDGPGEGKEDEERERAVAGVFEVEQEMRCLDRGAEQQQRKRAGGGVRRDREEQARGSGHCRI